ncbi:cell division protein FtsA [Candidatus Roizmanbacteria bacterium]|nr:cell division protein FtsA [Candidatus Roizmanbacteria bacterium]
MPDTVIAAIDIGSSKIATIVGLRSQESPELRIVGYNTTPSRGVKKGLIVDIDQVTAAIEESVEKAERMAGHKINHAYISVGGPHISSLNSHGVVAVSHPQGEIVEDDVNRVIEAARAISLSSARQIIEVSPRDYIVDGQAGIKNPIGMTGIRLEVNTHLITASTTNLNNLERSLAHLGLENDGFIFAGLASAEAVLTDTEKELGVILIDIGGGKIDMCIYVEGSLSYSTSVPVGAKHITNDIAVGLRVSLDSAEKIKLFLSKRRHDPASHGKKETQLNLNELQLPENINDVSLKTLVDGIIAPRLEEIYKLIFDEIEKSGFANLAPSGLVVSGGGALTLGMLETGKRIIGMPIRLGIPEGVTGLVDEILNPPSATIVGLMLCGKKDTSDDTKWKDFNKIIKDFSFGSSFTKIKNLVKQFIP